MLAYAANAPRRAERPSSPHAMLAIIAAHVALLAAVMSARMEIPRHREPPIIVEPIPVPKPPPPNPAPRPVPHPEGPMATHNPIPLPPLPQPTPTPFPQPHFDPVPVPQPTPMPNGGAGVPHPPLARSAPELLTPPSELKPPYPASKLASEEEALLRLRLTIDERGRVVGVDPIGAADRVFLDAARRYLLAHWRYKPASEGGHAVQSTIVITLHFHLDG
jgi:periplasmic protein TonB